MQRSEWHSSILLLSLQRRPFPIALLQTSDASLVHTHPSRLVRVHARAFFFLPSSECNQKLYENSSSFTANMHRIAQAFFLYPCMQIHKAAATSTSELQIIKEPVRPSFKWLPGVCKLRSLIFPRQYFSRLFFTDSLVF